MVKAIVTTLLDWVQIPVLLNQRLKLVATASLLGASIIGLVWRGCADLEEQNSSYHHLSVLSELESPTYTPFEMIGKSLMASLD